MSSESEAEGDRMKWRDFIALLKRQQRRCPLPLTASSDPVQLSLVAGPT
jgi:hypothetical protein